MNNLNTEVFVGWNHVRSVVATQEDINTTENRRRAVGNSCLIAFRVFVVNAT